MDDIQSTDEERIDPRRVLLLGAWTAVLAIAFTVLLISDTVTAASF